MALPMRVPPINFRPLEVPCQCRTTATPAAAAATAPSRITNVRVRLFTYTPCVRGLAFLRAAYATRTGSCPAACTHPAPGSRATPLCRQQSEPVCFPATGDPHRTFTDLLLQECQGGWTQRAESFRWSLAGDCF